MYRKPDMPRYACAVVEALRLDSPDTIALRALSETEWQKALAYADRTRLTLPLGLEARDLMPDWVRAQVNRRFEQNSERWRRTQITYSEIADAFESEAIEFAVVKGFAHCPLFARTPAERWQGDLDLFLTSEQARRAFQIARGLGYEPVIPEDQHPLNHLPTLVRSGDWKWKGDFFDVEMPLALELHFRLWDPETEGFELAGLDQLWERRTKAEVDGVSCLTLDPADAVAYSALHLARHLLHGNLRVSHVYELAWMLHDSSLDSQLWERWQALHDPSLRRLEAVCFSLAEKWFACRTAPVVRGEIVALPADVTRWLNIYGNSALEAEFHPNKDELWLHWALLDSHRARAAVLRRRLLPTQLPSRAEAGDAENSIQFARRVAGRAVYHTRTLWPTALSAARWFGGGFEFSREFWRFLLAEAFFDFGMFIFVFLYNLYLLQLGFREDFLGRVSGLMMAGNVVGCVGAAFLMQRFGTRRTLGISFALTAGISIARATARSPGVLLSLAAGAGLLSSVWPVALAPVVAAVTTEKNRRVGFSLVCSSGIAIGIVGGLAAGHLPGWLTELHWAGSTLAAYRLAMALGCAFVLLGLLPLRGMKAAAAPAVTFQRFHKPNPLVLRFLAAMMIWNLGTGLFNSFTTVFFARQVHLAVDRIGYIFSGAQIAQVAAVLAAPIVFRKFGLRRSIAGMEFATALALFALAQTNGVVSAAVGYCFYMMAQYMSEPGMFTWLMESSELPERGTASAWNLLVMFAGQGIGARSGGRLAETFGYPVLLTAAAITCCAAAILFQVLLKRRTKESRSVPVFVAGRV